MFWNIYVHFLEHFRCQVSGVQLEESQRREEAPAAAHVEFAP